MQISKTVVSVALSATVLVACGGGSGIKTDTTKSVAAPAIRQETINGIVVPPDPGAAKDATLAGADTDHNGIRDEIDRWIATQYGDKPGALDAIRWSARASQKQVVANPTSKTEALALVHEVMDIGGCIGGKLRTEGLVAGVFFNEKMLRTFNTRERIDARKRIFDMAGMIVRSVDESTISCPYPDSEND